MPINKKMNERKEIGVGFTEIIIHNFINFVTFIVCLIANFLFFLFSFLITYLSFLETKYFFFVFSVVRSIKLIIFSLFFGGIIFIKFHLITILLLKFFIFSLEFLSIFFSGFDLLLSSYFLIIDIFLILLLAIPLVYILNFIPDLIAMFPEFPRHFIFEGTLRVQLLKAWEQYFIGMSDGPKDGFPVDAHIRKPPGDKLVTDEKSPLVATLSYQYWLDHTYSIRDRVGSDLVAPDKRGLIANFIYNHVKDDSLLRLIRAAAIPRSLREAINDFDRFSSDLITKIDSPHNVIGGKPLFWSGHWRDIIAPLESKTDYLMEDYRLATWAFPGGANNLANFGVLDVNSKPIKSYLLAGTNAMPEDQKMYPYNEDFKIWELFYWRSSFQEETRGKIVPLIYNSSVATFFNFKRMAFKWMYHYTYQIIFLPFLYLNFYNGEGFFKKFRLMLYSTVDFFLEFGYNVPGSRMLDYNFFIYNLEFWIGNYNSLIFMGASENDSILMDSAVLIQRFFFYTDTGFNVLFLNSSLTEKSFLNMTFYDWAFFGFPFLLTFLFLCFIIYPILQSLTLITHHNWAEVAQAPWVAFSDPNPLHYQSFDFFLAPSHLFYFGLAFVMWFFYYFNVFTPLLYIDSTSMAIERDLTKFYSYPAFDDFSLNVEDDDDIAGDDENSLEDMEDVEMDSMLESNEDEDNFELVDYDEGYFDFSNHEAFIDPPDLGFLTVNDTERETIYRNFRKDNFLTYNSKSFGSLDWLESIHNKILKNYAVPVNKIKLGKEKFTEVQFDEDIVSPFKKLIEYQYYMKHSSNDKDYMKTLVDKREQVPNLSFLLHNLAPLRHNTNFDIYPGLKAFSSRTLPDQFETINLKKEYFSFWFLDRINHINVKDLTVSRSFSVFAVEALVSFYFFFIFGSLYYLLVDGVIYTIFLYIFSFALFIFTISICYIVFKFLYQLFFLSYFHLFYRKS